MTKKRGSSFDPVRAYVAWEKYKRQKEREENRKHVAAEVAEHTKRREHEKYLREQGARAASLLKEKQLESAQEEVMRLNELESLLSNPFSRFFKDRQLRKFDDYKVDLERRDNPHIIPDKEGIKSLINELSKSFYEERVQRIESLTEGYSKKYENWTKTSSVEFNKEEKSKNKDKKRNFLFGVLLVEFIATIILISSNGTGMLFGAIVLDILLFIISSLIFSSYLSNVQKKKFDALANDKKSALEIEKQEEIKKISSEPPPDFNQEAIEISNEVQKKNELFEEEENQRIEKLKLVLECVQDSFIPVLNSAIWWQDPKIECAVTAKDEIRVFEKNKMDKSDIPQYLGGINSRGTMSKTAKTKKVFTKQYENCLISTVVSRAYDLFDALPKLQKVNYTITESGMDIPILEVVFTRNEFESIELSQVDPMDFLTKFEHKDQMRRFL